MKKTLKTLALITATWTVAEFVTMWRVQDTPLSLKKYTRIYFKGQKQAWNASVAAGEKLGNGDLSGFTTDMKDLNHRKFYAN